MESCGGYVPAKFYDSAAGECAAFAACAAPAVLNAGTNLCDCPTPNVGTDGAAGPGDCAAPTPSADSCGRYVPAKFYDSAAGECAAVAACLAPAVLNAGANLCDCPSPNVGTDGAAEPGDCAVPAPSADSCGGLIPAQFYDAGANACVPYVTCASPEVLYAEANDCHAASDDPLGDAVRAGDLDLAGHFITVHMADVNRANASGATPLHWAAIGGHAAIAATLLAAGASVDAKDEDDETPLHFAARNGRASVVATLLARGADVNAKDEDDNTPLHFAANNGSAAVAAALLAAGAEVNAKNDDDETPLRLAVGGGHAVVAAALIAGGAHWGDAACGIGLATNPAGATPPCVCEPPTVGTAGNCVAPSKESCGGLDPAQFYDAAAGACVLFVTCGPGEFLYPEANDCHAAESHPLHRAVFAGDLDLVNHFITVHMADLEERWFGDTPLHIAARFRRATIAAALLAAGADVNAAGDRKDETALHYAINSGHAAIIATLLAAEGVSVNVKNDDDDTPLHYAANGGHASVVAALIAAGADVNAKNDEDDTPLRWAAGADYVTVVVLLLEAGADVDGRNDDDETPLHWAARNGRVAPVAALIAGGADVDAQDKDDDTPLHFVARNGRAAIVPLLIQATASLNVKNEDDDTPLHLAVEGGYAAVVAMLIAGGAHWGDAACGIGEAANPAGPAPPCVCASNAGTPGNCIAASAEVCGGLTPAQFYDAAAGACVPYVQCVSPEVLHADVNDCHAASDYPLHDAVLAGDLELVNHFITVHMADVHETWFAHTPLHFAASGGHADIAAALLAAGASVNAKNENDETPLHFVALNFSVGGGHASVVAALLAGGAEVNAKNEDDETPLHFAVEGGHASAAAALIAGGAHWGEAACGIGEATNPAGAAPPCLCEPPTVGISGNCGAPNTERCGVLTPAQFYDAAAAACVPFVTCGPGEVVYKDVNDCHAASAYPLHDAARAGNLNLVNHFITVHMADVNGANASGETPLHAAADRKQRVCRRCGGAACGGRVCERAKQPQRHAAACCRLVGQ